MVKKALSSDIDTIIEEKQALMVSNGKPCLRIAHFLKPLISSSSNQSQTFVDFPSIQPSKPISPILKLLTSNVHFNGWKHAQKDWTSWVEKIRPLYESIWKKASIFDAIMCSTLEIPKCRPSIFGLAEKWCSETNTFVLPWGEVTITLEDVMVLGGFSVTGDSVLSELSSKKLLEIEDNLLMVRNGMMRSKSRKASQQQWLDIWRDKRSEFEHEAFLSYWLSRYVLPADDKGTINKSVFQIAVLLARGHKIALAPAVLASLYRDLRLLKDMIASVRELSDQDDVNNDANVAKLAVWSPFQLLQVWIWERFLALSPKTNSVVNGLARLRRWHKVKVVKRDDVGVFFDSSSGDFQWRPYSTRLNNGSLELDLESYGRCIRVSILVGLDCIESYFPHRVAMQFGLDQDIPVACPRLSDETDANIAWSRYNKPIGDVNLYMPPKLFEPDVTSNYLEWWKKSTIMKGRASCDRKLEGSSKVTMDVTERMRIKVENNEAEVPLGFTPIGKRDAVETDVYSHEHQPSSKRSRRSPDVLVIDIENSYSDISAASSVQIKDVKPEQDSDDDKLTLSQLFRATSNKVANRSSTMPISHQESPISSAGDNASIQEMNPTEKYPGDNLPGEICSREVFAVEDGTECKAKSAVRNSTSMVRNEVQTSFSGAHESSSIDLLDRIARLQRIIDKVIAAKANQA